MGLFARLRNTKVTLPMLESWWRLEYYSALFAG